MAQQSADPCSACLLSSLLLIDCDSLLGCAGGNQTVGCMIHFGPSLEGSPCGAPVSLSNLSTDERAMGRPTVVVGSDGTPSRTVGAGGPRMQERSGQVASPRRPPEVSGKVGRWGVGGSSSQDIAALYFDTGRSVGAVNGPPSARDFFGDGPA